MPGRCKRLSTKHAGRAHAERQLDFQMSGYATYQDLDTTAEDFSVRVGVLSPYRTK